MGDFNSDIRKGKILRMCNRRNLNEKILLKHGKNPPATYDRNSKRIPIDGIIGSRSSQFHESEYLGFGEGFDTDHRILWVKTQEKEIFGGKIRKTNKSKPKRLKSDDPRLVNKYNKQVHKKLIKYDCYTEIEIVIKESKEGWNTELEERYNNLHRKTIEIRKKIEKKIKKIGNGSVPWNPKMKLASYNIKYWKLTKKRHEKGRVSSKTLCRLGKQLNIKKNNNLNDEIIAQELTLAYDRYKEIKNKAPQDRKKFLWKLAMAKEQEDGIDASKHIKTLIQVEKQRKQARAITIMRGTKKERRY